jgi:hypothetical protein
MPPRLAAFASRIGLTGLAIAVLLTLLAVQTVRLEGFKLWPILHEGWKPKAERYARDLANVKAAQQLALERAQAAKLKAEADYRNLAERIDDDAEQARAGALDDAERFIAANRVRCQAAGRAGSGTVAAASDHSAGDGQGSGQASELDDAVAVKADDVRICTANTLQAEAARAWALELETPPQ